jgi:hypothetical protein
MLKGIHSTVEVWDMVLHSVPSSHTTGTAVSVSGEQLSLLTVDRFFYKIRSSDTNSASSDTSALTCVYVCRDTVRGPLHGSPDAQDTEVALGHKREQTRVHPNLHMGRDVEWTCVEHLSVPCLLCAHT